MTIWDKHRYMIAYKPGRIVAYCQVFYSLRDAERMLRKLGLDDLHIVRV